MKHCWLTAELADQWTLTPEELRLLRQKTDHNRLGFALLLKFHTIAGRFPEQRDEVPEAAIRYVAQQLVVEPEQLQRYDWQGRSAFYHRVAIRAHLGFREATVQDASPDHLQAMVYERCRARGVEPPAPDRVERIARSAVRTAHENLYAAVSARLSPATWSALNALLETPDPGAEEERLPLNALKADPGAASVDNLLAEIAKLQAIRQVDLPAELFAGVAPRLVGRWRQRAAAEPPRELRAHAEPLRYTLLAAFCSQRSRELTDNLVDLLIGIVHRIGARAEKKVKREFLTDIERVPDKQDLLFELAAAAVVNQDGRVRDVIFPVIGEPTLWALVREHAASGPSFRERVQRVMHASYRSHYRRMVPAILAALEFRSNNATHQPVIRALELLRGFAGRKVQYYEAHTQAPIDGVVRPKWRELLLEAGRHGTERVPRINYEICVLEALREKLRCKEIWVVGADRYCNPDDDLPADFEQRHDLYYAALHLTREAEAFIAPLREQMTEALATLDRELPRNRAVQITKKAGGWIKLTPLDALPESANVDQIKAEVAGQWPMTNLLDILKEAGLRTSFTDRFTSVASREMLDRETVQKRLLLCLYGLGTNMGIKRVSAGQHGEAYRDLLYVRRRFLHREQCAQPLATWSMRCCTCGKRTCGARAPPPALRTPRSSGRGTRT